MRPLPITSQPELTSTAKWNHGWELFRLLSNSVEWQKIPDEHYGKLAEFTKIIIDHSKTVRAVKNEDEQLQKLMVNRDKIVNKDLIPYASKKELILRMDQQIERHVRKKRGQTEAR
ncbi:hypothetical protein Ciccas_012481, partial [Cichlidogyrus casuarinus]